MEPTIELSSDIHIPCIDYKKLLSDKIKSVCSKIGFSYNGIKWIIYVPKTSKRYFGQPNQVFKSLITKKNTYGFCVTEEKTIWISTLALEKEHSANLPLNNKLNHSYLGISTNNNKDLLANVILDELAHIATRCDHGHPKYENKLRKFHNAYYI